MSEWGEALPEYHRLHLPEDSGLSTHIGAPTRGFCGGIRGLMNAGIGDDGQEQVK